MAGEEAPAGGSAPRGPGGSSSGWSFRVATALGIPIRIHFTFFLLLFWFGSVSARQGEGFFQGVIFLLLLFGCVVLHELGHAAMARQFGVSTREIVLYPIGGVARLDRMPGGKAELLIALAGPAVNLALAGMLFAALLLMHLGVPGDPETVLARGSAVQRLLAANVVLFVFNLVPALPMDGGRVLRASLTFFVPERRATEIAAAVGQALAVLFGAVGLFIGNPVLVFIALFVFLGATQEASFHRSRALVRGRTARHAMITRFEVLQPQDSLGRASELLLATHQQDFPVLDAWGRVAGIVTRRLLLAGLAAEGPSAPVLSVMRREVPRVEPDTKLEQVLTELQRAPDIPVLVVEGEQLRGMITLENLRELLEIRRVTASEASSG